MLDTLYKQFAAPLDLAGRVLIAFIFVVAGYGKITGYDGAAGYMQAMGVPGALLPLVILTELGGGIAIVVGFQTRIVATLLAGFCVLSALIFHNVFHGNADQMTQIMFMKNLAMAGGFLFLAANGAGAWSLDAKSRK